MIKIIAIALTITIIILVDISCLVVSGKCSRLEEKQKPWD